MLPVCLWFQDDSEDYTYKVKIFDPHKKRKFTVRELHRFSGKLSSIEHIREVLSDELEEVPDENSKYNMGYFEGRHQTKRWLASVEDLNTMYKRFLPGSEIFLWCEGREGCEDSPAISTKRKSLSETSVNKRQAREEELDSIFKQLKEKHDDAYSSPQLRLWARMIVSGTHSDLDSPPRVPMIIGAPLPKRQKQESLSTALVGAATAFAKALSPQPTSPTSLSTDSPTAPETAATCPVTQSRVGVSPAKAADVRMKNLEQLRYIQQLMEDGILSEAEFLEQKRIILDTLRCLHV